MDGARRRFRWKKWMTVLLGIAAAIFLYARFLNGTLPVDAAIVNEENLEKIAANWDKLLASERFVSWHDCENADVFLMLYRQEESENSPMLVGRVWIKKSGWQSEKRGTFAEYHRSGVIDSWSGLFRFGECEITLYGVSEHCIVEITAYDTHGSMDRAYKPIREALEIIDGSAG